MTLQGYLTSPIGILNIVSVLINAAAILCVSIRWNDDGNVLMQLIFQDRGWQTAVLIFLVASITVTASLLLIRTCASRAKIESMRKITIISLLIGTVFLCAFASAIEIWYVVRSDNKDKDGKDSKSGLERVVVCMILSLLLFIVNFLLTMLLLCNFDHYTKMEQQTPVVAPAHPPVDPRDQRSSHHPPPPHPPIIMPLPRHDPPMTIEAPPPHSFTKAPQGSPVVTLPPSPPPQRRRRSNSDSD